MPFKMSSLRHKKSKAMFAEEEEEPTMLIQEALDRSQPAPDGVQRTSSKKQAMQDFFRATGANLKTTGANIKASSAKLPRHMTVRKARVAKQQQPPSKRNSTQQPQSLDVDGEALEKLMGPPKCDLGGRIQSDSFLLKQRIQASSRAAASSRTSPLSTPGRSQAELDRQPLGVEEVQDLFVGAPYFEVKSLEGGGYRPQVIFRAGDVEESARYGGDYTSLGHYAFETSTLSLDWTRETAVSVLSDGQRVGALPAVGAGLLEVPGMLSANGLDPGTIGYEHFLQLPIADSTALPDEPIFFDKRKLMYTEPEKLGLRELNMAVIVDRLNELGAVQAAKNDIDIIQNPWSKDKIEEMGEDLFADLLDPELGTTEAGTGSVTLRTQCEALQKVLNERDLWHDFSQVEWRIRVGQLLWSSQEDQEPPLDGNRQPSERDVLLLHITLAAELLVRLDVLDSADQTGDSVETEHGHAISALQQSRKVKWDLLLAQTFLTNLTISAKVRDGSSKAGNRSSLFSTISFMTARETTDDEEQPVQPLLLPKHEAKQLAGLLYFVKAIGWPHADDVQSELEAKLTARERSARGQGKRESQALSMRPISGVSIYATPLSSPGFAPSVYAPSTVNRNSYFGGLGADLKEQQMTRPGVSRMTTANSMHLLAATSASAANADAFEVGGWLSRSWLTGLVLPGEPASHFLISTLLENSPQAIAALGDSANLYGGFVYAGRSFWSKSCVVGRVLAAMKGANECMGWVSVPGTPDGREEDGWVDLDIMDVPGSTSPADARIKRDGAVAKDSDPLHGSSISTVQAGDFTKAMDSPPVMGNEVQYHGLSFTHSTSTAKESPHMTFSSPLNHKLLKLDVPLTYDVHFVASYPCHPSSPQRSPTSSSVGLPSADDESSDAKSSATHRPTDSARASATHSGLVSSLRHAGKALPPPPTHPLHIDYHYEVVPVATLLSSPPESGRSRTLSLPASRSKTLPTGALIAPADEVVVLDCRGTPDLELLARSWCAKVGEDALVGKSGRTCLACCVREARALDVRVVIRI
ncbi:hypothetical protein LTR08_003773 [Meristemomyces frigidus]|nr:hypothetical protein LTR08_003773 [Meristemomyces frigidus]